MRGSLPVGYVLNRYRIESVLSEAGNFAVVYLASDIDLARTQKRADAVAGRLQRWRQPERFGPTAANAAIDWGPLVAIKEYAPDGKVTRRGSAVVPEPKHHDVFNWGRDRFVQESVFMAQLSHPNIVALFDHFQANNTAYYVMERLAGGSLADLLAKRGRQSEADVRQWLGPLLRAVAHVDHCGGNHLDVAPGNVMFRRSTAEPVLVDFGAARIPGAPKPNDGSRMVVNDCYAPPEKYAVTSRDLNARVDVYSVGAVVQEALTGTPPRTMMPMGAEPDSFDPAIVKLASPDLARAVKCALARNPTHRFANGQEFLAAIDPDHPIVYSGGQTNSEAGDNNLPTLILLAAGAALLLLIVALAMTML